METMTKLLPVLTWRKAITLSGLPPTTRLVALTVSLYMNEMGGSAFPGASRLVSDTGLSDRAVRGHLKLLVDTGWLALVERGGLKGERKTANAYQAVIPNPCTTIMGEGTVPLHDVPVTPAPPAADPCTTCSPTLQELSTNSSMPTAKKKTYDEDFTEWWSDYPRKVNKSKAFTAYKARRREGVSHDRLITARDFYAISRAGEPDQFTLHPSTFLAKDGPWSEWESGPESVDLTEDQWGVPDEPKLVLPPARVEVCPVCESSLLACQCKKSS